MPSFFQFSLLECRTDNGCKRVAKLLLLSANLSGKRTMSAPTDDIANILIDICNQDVGATNISSNSSTKVSRKRHNRDTDAVIGLRFHIISDTTAARLAAAAAMTANNITEEGQRFAVELSTIRRAVDVTTATYVMWPAEDLDEGETLNGDAAADLNWVLAIIIAISISFSTRTTKGKNTGYNFL